MPSDYYSSAFKLVRDNCKTSVLQKELGDKRLEVFWSKRNENWFIRWRGNKFMELRTGENFDVNKIKRAFFNVKNKKLKEMEDEAKKTREHEKEKSMEILKDVNRHMAKDMLEGTDERFVVTSARGNRSIVFQGRKKKSYHFPSRRQK